MSNQIEFMACPHCGKSVRTNAAECHRCHKPLRLVKVSTQTAKEPVEGADQAAIYGGYDGSQDDFDYDEFLSNEFGAPKKTTFFSWRTVAWGMVFVMIAPIAIMAYQLWQAVN